MSRVTVLETRRLPEDIWMVHFTPARASCLWPSMLRDLSFSDLSPARAFSIFPVTAWVMDPRILILTLHSLVHRWPV